MKNRLQITLEDEANELLNKQENKSKFIEDLILKQDNSDLTSEIKRLCMLVDGQVNDIQDIQANIATIKQKLNNAQLNSSSSQPTGYSTISEYPKEFVPKPPHPDYGYPCCIQTKPCKHWTWDATYVLWVNELTGKTRSAEA